MFPKQLPLLISPGQDYWVPTEAMLVPFAILHHCDNSWKNCQVRIRGLDQCNQRLHFIPDLFITQPRQQSQGKDGTLTKPAHPPPSFEACTFGSSHFILQSATPDWLKTTLFCPSPFKPVPSHLWIELTRPTPPPSPQPTQLNPHPGRNLKDQPVNLSPETTKSSSNIKTLLSWKSSGQSMAAQNTFYNNSPYNFIFKQTNHSSFTDLEQY